MKSRSLITITSLVVALILLAGACSAGFIAGRVLVPGTSRLVIGAPGQVDGTSSSNAKQPGGTPKDVSQLFAPFWQAWQLVHNEYVDQPVNDVTLMRGAIKGMLESLGDKHSSYFTPEQLTQVNAHLNGETYEGIGAWVDVTGKYLSIIGPIPGSPAEKAGLKLGDLIIAVDGQDMTGQDGDLVRQKLLGPKGTTVRLTIRRPSVDQPFDVEIQRASITIPSVTGKMLDGNIAFVQLFTFGDKTSDDLRAVLKDLLAQHPAGLVLDLRGNGGGYLDTGIAVASEFIRDGVVMYEQYGDGQKKTFQSSGNGLATDIPLVVLINQGSASASEIVAGAIQDRGRGKLVGVTSYGKGSVQVITPLSSGEGAIRVTVARWLTPNGKTIQEVGLKPDVEVKITEDDIKTNRDPQLDQAVALLTQK
ncbi:MAG TPA: S41 family peptidase [Anaerolineales bacterium]